jgi:chromosome segregation ATPase
MRMPSPRSFGLVGGALLVGGLFVGGLGCAGLSHRVDRSLLDQVPNEELLLLFDAENGVYIARDEAELATRNLEDARKALRRADDYRKLIDERRKSGAAIDSAEVLQLLEEWNEARIAMRKREVELRQEELRTSDVRLWAARARYEQAKAKLIKDFNPVGGARVDLTDFDEQVAKWEEREQKVLALLKEREDEMLSAREAYIALAVRLQQVSKGAYGGPWADLLD